MLRTTILTGALALCALISAAKDTLGIKGEEAASIGLYVVELNTGRVLSENDSKKALVPASVMKSVTAATALELLGPDFRFATQVTLRGTRDTANPALFRGDIVIESSADPTINSELFDGAKTFQAEIADALAAKGLRRITGQIIISQTLKDPGCPLEWQLDDTAWAYGAGLFGFNFNDNTFRLWPATGKTSPKIPYIRYSVHRSDGTNLVRGIGSDSLAVYGLNPANAKWSVRSTIPDPARAFVSLLKAALADRSIRVEGGKPSPDAPATPLLTHRSEPLAAIVKEMMHESHNLYAEALLRAIAPADTREAAIKREKRLWADRGLSTSLTTILDGSGLARGNRLSPAFLADIFARMAKSANAQAYVASFPRAGESGTVASLLKKSRLKGSLALKSGSMNGVQCFAGYRLDANSRPTHAVVILVNGFYCSRTQLRTAIENYLERIFPE